MPVIDGRQDAPNLEGIRADHLNRYGFAADWLCRRFDRPFTVLDAACGVGYGSRLLAEAGGLVTGVDIAQAAIDKARRHFAHPAVRFCVRDLGAGALGQFDAVVSFETIEHVAQASALVEGFRRAAPLLIASVPNQEVLPFRPDRDVHHRRHYRPAEFAALLSGYRLLGWWTQLDKRPGRVVEGAHGRHLVVIAQRIDNSRGQQWL